MSRIVNHSKIKGQKRFSELATLGEIVFHANDVANLWGITNKDTLHKTLSRYVTAGVLHRIRKGLYSLKPINDLDPNLIGIKVLHRPAYISCESVLFNQGIINQRPTEITLISNVSRRFSVAGYRFRSRKLKDKYLINDQGIEKKDGRIRIASLPRAIADMMYFNSKKYIDVSNSRLIDWNEINNISQAIGYPKILIKKHDIT